MSTIADAIGEIRLKQKTVVTFAGYSSSEYEDKDAMGQIATERLMDFNAVTTIVCIGASTDGIGAVYKIAKEMGFETIGIVSSLAIGVCDISSHCDTVYYMADDLWGGVKPGTNELSPTSQVIVGVSDVFLAIGGNNVARDEYLAAQAVGKDVRFYPADMNHALACQQALGLQQPEPTDFRGSLHLDVNQS